MLVHRPVASYRQPVATDVSNEPDREFSGVFAMRTGPETEGAMRLCLVEDNAVAGLEPLTLTRPVFDLLLGAGTIGGKIARAFGVGPGPNRRGVVIRPYLAMIQKVRDPHA